MKDWKEMVQKIGEKASQITKQATEEAKVAIKKGELSLKLSGLESKKRETLAKLGDRVYGLLKQGQAPEFLKVLGEDLFRDLQEIDTEISLVHAQREILKKGKESR